MKLLLKQFKTNKIVLIGLLGLLCTVDLLKILIIIIYKRLKFYNKITGEYVNDYLSELIESTTEILEQNKCIAIEETVELLPLNFGYISSYYYIKTDTVELFSK